jgi:hypothetical protein
MSLEKAESYRREAQKCLEKADLADDDFTRSRLRWLADEWLDMAFREASRIVKLPKQKP